MDGAERRTEEDGTGFEAHETGMEEEGGIEDTRIIHR
jgi:hypothetical protein